MLIDAAAYAVSGIPPQRGAEWIHYQLGSRKPGAWSPAPLSAGTDPEAGVPVYVNHGRWVVDCPDCCNAQLACRTDHRFLCNECGNVAVGRLWRPALWPDNADAIEKMLDGRPKENQNWQPGESKVGLAIDNLMHMGRIK